MKILHVVPTYFPAVRYGGPIFSVHGLCSGQAKNGHDVSVYTTDVDGPDSLDVPLNSAVDLDGVNVHYFKADQAKSGFSRRLYRSKTMAHALTSSIKDFDVVHLHSIYLWPTWFAARKAHQYHVPYVLSPRGMLVKELIQQKSAWLKRAWLLFIERSNIKNAAALHYTSEREKTDAVDYVNGDGRDFVLANGINANHDSLKPTPFERKSKEILYLGRVHWKKGLERLIAAIENVPDAKLVIAGNDEEGYAKKLEKLISDKQLQQRVELRGFVAGEEKRQLLSSTTMLVLCSDNENFGNVVLEAMAVGTPVVVTQSVGASEIVEQYQAGLVSKGAPADLAENISALLQNREMRLQLGENGRQATREHFNWTAIASTMVNHYQSILTAMR